MMIPAWESLAPRVLASPPPRLPPSPESPVMVLWTLRGSFLVLLLGVGLYALDSYTKAARFGTGILALGGILAFGVLVVITDVKVRDKQITTISAGYFGL